MDEWHEWRSTKVTSTKVFPKKFISFNDLLASRFCLSFIPLTQKSARDVEVAFMALDSEKIGDDVNDSQHFNFGDNQFPNYLGSLKEYIDIEDDIVDIEFKSVKKYIPSSIIEYITTAV